METKTFSEFVNPLSLLSESSSAMGLYSFEQQNKYSVIPNYIIRWDGWNISFLLENWREPDDIKMSGRLTNQFYGRDMLNTWISDKAKNAPSIEKIREITDKIPSLTKLLER